MSSAGGGELLLEAPNKINYGGQSVKVGETVYRALRVLLAGGIAGVTEGEFCGAIWGEVPEHHETIRGVVFRVNEVLQRLGCTRRAMMDRGCVRLDGTHEGPALR